MTGGAGFVGSHLVDRLMSLGNKIYVLDSLTTGRFENIKQWQGHPNFSFIHGDISDERILTKVIENCETIFHLAAESDVRMSSIVPPKYFQHNICGTHRLLESVRKVGNIENFVFASTSSVYGDALKVPTPEDYAPVVPISVYGASKLACEALIMAYAFMCRFKARVYRFANIIGPRMRSGVIYDFIVKLTENPRGLEILGDGMQTKSYLFVDDLIEAMFLCLRRLDKQVDVINIGSVDHCRVRDIAEMVVEEMELKDVDLKFTCQVNGGRGWIGDIKNEYLDVSRLRSLGWKPIYSSEDAIRTTIKLLLKEITR